MTAQKSVLTSLSCFCLVQKSLAPDSAFNALPMGKRHSQARFLSERRQSTETIPRKQRSLLTNVRRAYTRVLQTELPVRFIAEII